MIFLPYVQLAQFYCENCGSMHRAPSAASKSKDRCIGRRLPHRNRKTDASDTVCSIETGRSMHRTPFAASKPEHRCIGRGLLHRNRKTDASDAVCCIETGTSMHRTPFAASRSKDRCIGRCLLHGILLIHTEQAINPRILRFFAVRINESAEIS
jgi:hypothetical protein